MTLRDRIFRAEREGKRGYAGVALYTFQVTFGVTLRWYERQPHARLYVGPLKFYAGLFRHPDQPAFSGGDR